LEHEVPGKAFEVALHRLVKRLGLDLVELRQLEVQQHLLFPHEQDAALDALGGDQFEVGGHGEIELRTGASTEL
jgi:hypothetical protein